ncbi:hypothetical protein FA13DRAFT_1608877, partial [Coprinellus micaceus]
DGHYTAFTFVVGSAALKYGDSLHGPVPVALGPPISHVLTTPFLRIPSEIEAGVISRQGGRNGGDASCSLAALNFMKRVSDTGAPRWSGRASPHFRDAMLLALLRYHLIAREFTKQGNGLWTNWATPVSTDVANSLEQMDEVLDEEYSGLRYNDFNLYTPTV